VQDHRAPASSSMAAATPAQMDLKVNAGKIKFRGPGSEFRVDGSVERSGHGGTECPPLLCLLRLFVAISPFLRRAGSPPSRAWLPPSNPLPRWALVLSPRAVSLMAVDTRSRCSRRPAHQPPIPMPDGPRKAHVLQEA